VADERTMDSTANPKPPPGSGVAGDGQSETHYLRVGGEWLHTRYHPGSGAGSDVAIVFCPPFGWEEICSYRPLREWAQRLSAQGHPCLRLSLPGVGDSGGDADSPDRLEIWTRSVEVAASWLRSASGAGTVVAIGISLGGLLAYHAASASQAFDGLVLWATPPRGADLVRQLRAFSRLESSEFFIGADEPHPPSDDALEVGGFLMSGETVAALKALDLSELKTPELSLGVLALSLDGVGSGKLAKALGGRGLAIVEADGSGYGAMTAEPQTAAVPEAALGSVVDWLSQRGSAPTTGQGGVTPRSQPAVVPDSTDELVLPGGATEREFSLETPLGSMRGVLSRPSPETAPLCAIFLNAGGVRHVGPNRMWVEAARRWCGHGVASLRIDMPGLGESDGPTQAFLENSLLYRPELTDCTLSMIEELHRRGVAERFVLIGLCSGAYWAMQAGLADARVAGIALLNPRVIVYDGEIGAVRDLRRVFTDRSWARVRKNATPQRVWAVVRLLAAMPKRGLRKVRAATGGPPSVQSQIDATLERLRCATFRVFFAFSLREGLADELERTGWTAQLSHRANVTIRRIPVNDHTFRPRPIQRLVHEELDQELERVLAACGYAASGAESEATPVLVSSVGPAAPPQRTER
jgi:pimeloyl-ACP methyl ester carboxylesterase